MDLELFSTSNPFDELSVFNNDFSENAHTSTPVRNLNLKTKNADLNLTSILKMGALHPMKTVILPTRTLNQIKPDKTSRNFSSHENSVITEPESSLDSLQQTSCHSSEQSSSCSGDSTFSVRKSDILSFCVKKFQSIGNKKTDLHNLIVSSEPDIILGNETHLDPAVLDAEIYNIPPQPKYRLFRKDRKELVKKGEGVS